MARDFFSHLTVTAYCLLTRWYLRAEYITIAKKLTESGTIIMNIHCLKLALRTTIPVFMGYISCGIAFGLVTVNAG